MSNNTSWFIILQRQWEQKNEEISEFEEGGDANMKWLRIKMVQFRL